MHGRVEWRTLQTFEASQEAADGHLRMYAKEREDSIGRVNRTSCLEEALILQCSISVAQSARAPLLSHGLGHTHPAQIHVTISRLFTWADGTFGSRRGA